MRQCCRNPWDTYQEPIRMAPGVWYISGNNWVAAYLIDTRRRPYPDRYRHA